MSAEVYRNEFLECFYIFGNTERVCIVPFKESKEHVYEWDGESCEVILKRLINRKDEKIFESDIPKEYLESIKEYIIDSNDLSYSNSKCKKEKFSTEELVTICRFLKFVNGTLMSPVELRDVLDERH